MGESVKVPFSQVKHIVRACYGQEIKARRPVSIEPTEAYFVHDYWSEGSRTYCTFMNLQTLDIIPTSTLPNDVWMKANNPFNLPIGSVKLHPHIIVVENVIFCGKNLGFRIHVHPELYKFFKGTGFVGISCPEIFTENTKALSSGQ
jgi:hypothetical protein